MKYKKENRKLETALKTLKSISLTHEEKASIRENILSFIKSNPEESFKVCQHSPIAIGDSHMVQLYRDRDFMGRSAAAWLAEPLKNGGGAIVVSSPTKSGLISAEIGKLGIDVPTLEKNGRIAFVDSECLMARFMDKNMPDSAKFLDVLSLLIQGVRRACEGQMVDIRAWGDMVDALLKAGNLEAAKKIELLWNDVVESEGIRRLCSYQVDNLSSNTYDLLPQLCEGHSRLFPEEDEACFERELAKAMKDLMGEKESRETWEKFATEPRLKIRMPISEAVLFGLHATNPTLAKEILGRIRNVCGPKE